MARVFVTGSSTGLGLATATALVDDGHSVVVHARNHGRAAELDTLFQRGAEVVIGDLDLDYESFDLAGDIVAQTLVVYTAKPGTPSHAALQRLAEGASEPSQRS